MSSVRFQWSTYDYTFTDFTGGDLPRNFVSSTTLTQSATGARVYSGTPYAARFVWAISSVVEEDVARGVMDMFAAFDADRANGNLPTITITDTTFGATVNANGVFTTPPSVSRFGGSSSKLYAIAFGVTEA